MTKKRTECLICKGPLLTKNAKIYCSPECVALASRKRAHERSIDEVISIFWSRVEKTDGCWIWKGGDNGNGYGKMLAPYLLHKSRTLRRDFSHRISFWIFHGRLPNGLTRHTCDNRACVNPHHLLEGSKQDNVNDMFERGRACVGSKRKTAKLNEELVKWIRETKEGPTSIARKLGVDETTVISARKGRTWKHVI